MVPPGRPNLVVSPRQGIGHGFSVSRACRKWSVWRDLFGLAVAAVLGIVTPSASAQPTEPLLLPKPRPAEAQPREAPAADAPEPVASACRIALTEEIAIAPSIPPITGPGACGGGDLVRLEAVVLPGGQRVRLTSAAILRCAMASEVADWVRRDLAPLAESLGSSVAELDNYDSFDCRGRNRVEGAKMSEHGLANALDVRGFKLASGQAIALTERSVDRSLRETVLTQVCARFTTVLGPGSDWYHEDHIHLDLAERRGGYRLCQWNVYDPLPEVAPLLPEQRPAEASPREQEQMPKGGQKKQ